MKDTKRKIADKALEMFNEEGSSTLTVRHIAAALQISHGNLCYHYPTVDAIIIQLYEDLEEEITGTIEEALSHLQQ